MTPGPTWKPQAKAGVERGRVEVGRPPRSADPTLTPLAPNRLVVTDTDFQSASKPETSEGGGSHGRPKPQVGRPGPTSKPPQPPREPPYRPCEAINTGVRRVEIIIEQYSSFQGEALLF